MIELIVAIILMLILYLFGQILYPDVNEHKEIVPEPWQLDFQRHVKNNTEAKEDE